MRKVVWKRWNTLVFYASLLGSMAQCLGTLIYSLPAEQKKEVRELEKVSLKLAKSECSLLFNSVCLSENILPNYTNINLHDDAAKREPFTLKYRRQLVQREHDLAKEKRSTLEQELNERTVSLRNSMDKNIFEEVSSTISNNVEKLVVDTKLKMVRKLSTLYKNPIVLPEDRNDSFVNLSTYTPTANETALLNLGLNCHIQSPIDKYKRKVELEILYEQLLQLKQNDIVDISPDLQDQLRAEAGRFHTNEHSSILTPELRAAARSLRENPNIVIRRADKASSFVILNKKDYLQKINDLIKDGSKFKRITRNPCDDIKSKVNQLIDEANSATGSTIALKKIVGDYSPGYIYGNVKTHKEGAKLRPIISQVTTPTYRTAKGIDSIIKRYLPQGKMLKSTSEFVEMLSGHEYSGNLYSLDVESLFTNVPVQRTINIILEKVYNHPTIKAPAIPERTLRELLLICTREVPFKDSEGKMYIQVDGVSMGSPLGPTFANFFMAEVENRALAGLPPTSRPSFYGRYIDDIFTICEEEVLLLLQEELSLISGMNFTIERSVENKLPFLNVLVEKLNNAFKTTVYRKPTDNGKCLNAISECPDRYKQSVIKGFLHRAKNLSTYREDMLVEISRSKQILINNGYTNKDVDAEIRKLLRNEPGNTNDNSSNSSNNNSNNNDSNNTPTIHRVFYKNFMDSKYKKSEHAIRTAITSNVRVKEHSDRLQIVIYYKSSKTKNLIMRNNMTPKIRDIAKTNLIYDFDCKEGECIHRPLKERRYSGLTRCTLSRRLSFHLQQGAIKNHFLEHHKRKITRKEIVDCTRARYYERDVLRLEILESLIIRFEDPEVNRQETGIRRKLLLFGSTVMTTSSQG